jgi:hypothetical protein
MNYIQRRGLSRAEKQRHEEIRENYETGYLVEIYEKLRVYPLVRFKDSIRIQLWSSASKEDAMPRTPHDR